MKVFDKRPLSLILCILLGAFVFFTFGDAAIKIVIISIAILLLLSACLLFKITRTKKFMLALCGITIIAASLFSFIYFDLWYYAENRFEDRCEIEGTVESFDFSGANKTLVLSTDSIEEKALTKYTILVILEDDDITNITIGSQVCFSAEIKSFVSTSDFDAAAYYHSRGYSAQAINVENLTVTLQTPPTFSHKIAEYRRTLTRNLVMNSSRDSGGLLAALLLGEREFLDSEFKLDFARIGISHILALSGMHLAILCHAVSRILSLIGLNKKWRKSFEMLFAVAYMGLTGFPVSVVRAGIMLIISSLLFLLSSSKDSITNLFISVTVIAFLQPYSVFDMSLWLSAFATLGTIICVELLEKHTYKSRPLFFRIVFSVFVTFLTSIFAVGATLPIIHIYFNSISSLSLISTVIFSPVFLVFMYLGTFFLLTSSFIPLGSLINLFGDFITNLTHRLSSIKYALISTDFPIVKVLIIAFSVSLFLFFVLEIRKRKTATAAISFLLIVSIFSAGICTASENNDFTFEYSEFDGRERILMNKDADSCLIEISSLSNHVAYESVSYLADKHILYLNSYFLTSYTSNSLGAVEAILSKVFVKNIYVPIPNSEYLSDVYSEILNLNKKYDINVISYSQEEMIKFLDFNIFPLYQDNLGRLALTVNYSEKFFTYVSSSMLTPSTENYALKIMNASDTLIVGARGESENDPDFKYKIPKVSKLIFNKKSGLSDSVLKYYENRIVVDPNGTIDLYVE